MAKFQVASDPLLGAVRSIEGYPVLDRAVLLERIGAGGMGIVYRAHHLVLERDVAIKVLKPELALDSQYVERFLAEARVAIDLTHENVVRVHDVREDFGLYYMMMEFVDGEAVPDRVERWGRMREREAITMLSGAARGLAVAHGRGIVHRDIKPDNLMISRDGLVKLADLGLARPARRSGDTTTSDIMGTPQYMPPEQWRSMDVEASADVWALGATLHYLLTGKHAVPGFDMVRLCRWVQEHDLPSMRESLPSVADGVHELYEKCVRHDPKERFRDAVELCEAIDALGLVDESLLRVEQRAQAEIGKDRVELAEPMRLRIEQKLTTRTTVPPRAARRAGAHRAPAKRGVPMGWVVSPLLAIVAVVFALNWRGGASGGGEGESSQSRQDAVASLRTAVELEEDLLQGLQNRRRVTLSLRPEGVGAAKVAVFLFQSLADTEKEIAVEFFDSAGDANGIELEARADGDHRLLVVLGEEESAVSAEWRFAIDSLAPELEFERKWYTNTGTVELRGSCLAATSLTCGGESIAIGADGGFAHTIEVPSDGCRGELTATDRAHNQASVPFEVLRHEQPPKISWQDPRPGTRTANDGTMRVRVESAIPIRSVRLDVGRSEAIEMAAIRTDWQCRVDNLTGDNVRATVIAIDAAGNVAKRLRTINDLLQQGDVVIAAASRLTLKRVVLPASATPLWIGETEVTRGQWLAVGLPWKPAWGEQDERNLLRPVTRVVRAEIDAFCARLAAIARQSEFLPDGYRFGIPNEDEWEASCRAGAEAGATYCFGDAREQLATYAATPAGDGRPSPVGGSRRPNRFGLLDMHGNVWEWCTAGRDRSGGADTVCGGSSLQFHLDRGGGNRLGAASRNPVPSDEQGDEWVGFRVALLRSLGR